MRPIALRDRITRCQCLAGKLVRRTSIGGLMRNAHTGSLPPGTFPRSNRTPNITVKDCRIENCGGGIRLDGGHAVVDGLQVIDTPVAMELNGGATVDARRVSQSFSEKGRNLSEKGSGLKEKGRPGAPRY